MAIISTQTKSAVLVGKFSVFHVVTIQMSMKEASTKKTTCCARNAGMIIILTHEP